MPQNDPDQQPETEEIHSKLPKWCRVILDIEKEALQDLVWVEGYEKV